MRQDWIEVGQYLRSAMDEVAAASSASVEKQPTQ